MIVRLAAALLVIALFAVPSQAFAGKHGGKKKHKPLVVCKHGCKYRTIQKAVDKAGKKDTILVKPGTYSEGVLVKGSKYDGLTIKGTSSNPKKVKLNGKNASGPDGVANSGIEVDDVTGFKVKNLWAKNYAANGIFLRDSNPTDEAPNKSIKCRDYLVKNVITSFNRAYGVYAFGCIGGRISRSTGYGQGDSAFYIGATPPQVNPKWTSLDHLDGHENVLGYSGTNSRYVDIKDSNFYNNGVGVVPNTLDSEPYIPTATGKIRRNNIFWNNFNYFLPNSRVATVSDGLGEIPGFGVVQYPTGVGIVLLGSDGWVVSNNNIFGNFKYGAATVSNPLVGPSAQVKNNQFVNNTMGKGGTDTNAVDFFADGSGSANCWEGNTSSTFDSSSSTPDAELYPDCANAAGTGTGTEFGDNEQFGEILTYATTDPPENQECSWIKHSHPAFKSYTALSLTPGPDCGP
ncbi:hypothetical protein BH10ACT11_BH10ACT11_02340 [soil metagenome]